MSPICAEEFEVLEQRWPLRTSERDLVPEVAAAVGVDTAPLMSCSRRPGVWRSYGRDWPPPTARWMLVGRRSQWTETVVAQPKPPRRGGADREAVAGTLGCREDVSDGRWRIRKTRRQEDPACRSDGPAAGQGARRLVAQLGSHLDIAAPVAFGHRGPQWAARFAARRAGPPAITTTRRSMTARRWYREPRLRRCPRHLRRHDGPRETGNGSAVPSRASHREIPQPPDATAARRDIAIIGVDANYHSKRQRAPGQAPTTTDFQSGHPPSRRGDRDRQTWPRAGDQATAWQDPRITEDPCGHTTGQPRSSSEPRWQAR